MSLKMRHVLVIYVLVLVLSLTRAEQKDKVQKPEVRKLEVVDFDEIKVTPNSGQFDVQRKRNSGYIYNKPNHISSSTRLRFQGHQSRGQIVSKFPGQLSRPFTKYGPPNHSTSGPITQRYRAQQHRNKLQHHVNQQSISFHDGLVEQEIPSPIRNFDFAEVNPIASQNNEPFGMHTANYLPPQNQKLPAYASTDNFVSQSSQSSLDHGQAHGINLQNQNLVQAQNHQISDAALFLSENAHAIQQLYGAPANDQNFAPNNDQFRDIGNQIQNLNDQFRNFDSTSQSSSEFRGILPSYASGTLNSQETLEQIQSLEKDRLIVQLQQALAQAQTTPRTAGRYAQNQASFIQNQELLESISQQIKSQISTPQTVAFGSENNAFSQSPFLPGTTVNPLKEFSFNYGVSTTTPITPTTTVTGISITRPPQASKTDDTAQIASSQPGSVAAGSPVKIPIYGGQLFVPTFITGTNLAPSYGTGIFTSKPVKPVQSETSPTHFGIPIPTEPSQKPAGLAPSNPSTIPSSTSSANQPGAFTPVITPITLPVQPIRPVAPPLHSLATPVHPVVTSVLPVNPQVYPAQVTPAVTSSVQHTYGIQNSLINPLLYKPVKAVYPVYYYPNVAYQLQKPALPNYPWSYAPSYTQTKPT
ncbi:hypothetical protein ACFW04_006073 [Cataglyphis niger]